MVAVVKDAIGSVPEDDDDDEGQFGGSSSDLDRLLADVEQYEAPPFAVEHPVLPAYTLTFRSTVSFDEIEAWRKKATTKKGRNGEADQVDAARAAALIVAGSCVGIYRDGKPLLDSRGSLVTFANREFQEKLGSLGNGAGAARKFLIRDAAVGTLSNKVVEANGFGEDAVDAADPTESA